MSLKIFKQTQKEIIAKKGLKVGYLTSLKNRITENFKKQLAPKVNYGNPTKNSNAEMNFVYEYLLKNANMIDNKLEKNDVILTRLVEYFD